VNVKEQESVKSAKEVVLLTDKFAMNATAQENVSAKEMKEKRKIREAVAGFSERNNSVPTGCVIRGEKNNLFSHFYSRPLPWSRKNLTRLLRVRIPSYPFIFKY
jgi:hypothetical protein